MSITRLHVELSSVTIMATKLIEFALEFECAPLYDEEGSVTSNVLFIIRGDMGQVDAAIERGLTATYKALSDEPDYRIESAG